MKKLIVPTRKEFLQKGWKKHQFELSNGIKFIICHNLPNAFGLNIDGAFDNWLARTSEYTDESFAEYIMSKHYLHGHYAYTRAQWDKLNE